MWDSSSYMSRKSSVQGGTTFAPWSLAIRSCAQSPLERRLWMNKTSLEVTPEEFRRRTRRGFLIAGVAAIAGGGLWEWLNRWTRIDGLNTPFHKVLDFNAAIARGLLRERTLAPEYARS